MLILREACEEGIVIDPVIAVSYVFDAEETSCNGSDTNLPESPTALEMRAAAHRELQDALQLSPP